jgi:hypothetical protein
MSDKNRNLFYLDELSGYKVASDYSDIRGWEVKDADHRTIGKVDHLLVNKETERVVYIDVEVDESLIEQGHDTYQEPASEGVHQFLNKDGENHLIIPIGMAHLDEENKYVITNEIDSTTFSKTRRFKKGDDFDFDYERNVLRTYRGDLDDDFADDDDDFYNRREFDNTFRRGDNNPMI